MLLYLSCLHMEERKALAGQAEKMGQACGLTQYSDAVHRWYQRPAQDGALNIARTGMSRS